MVGLIRNRAFVISVAAVGVAATFIGMLAGGWVALLAGQLGPAVGGLAGLLATALYFASRRISSDALELQATNALRRALLDSTDAGICVTDVAGNVILANAPMQRFAADLGLPADGTVAEKLGPLAGRTTDPARFGERMEILGRDLAASEDEFELTESRRVFRGHTAPVTRQDGTIVARIWTLREVTADRHLERLRDAFVGAVSHELRTPLTSIAGFVEMLGDEEEGLSSSGRTYLKVLERSTTRLQAIVEDLLLVAQIEANRLDLEHMPADLGELAAATVEAALPAAVAKGVELRLDAKVSIPLEADAARLRQVLDNLVSNALKFTPEGGAVTLSASNGGDRVRVEVSDTGIGIPRDEVSQLFSRFYRASTATRRAISGTGLGLVIARAIVERHDGTISLESREGEGTRVTVSLPVRQGAEPAAGGT
jgi:signal transduction histidine kinase